MFRQSYLLVAVLPLAFVAACGDKDTGGIIGGNTTASVRFINATALPISIANGGVVGSGNSNLSFGASSSCLPVDISNAGALTFTSNGTALSGFSPSLTAGGNFTVVAFTDANGNTEFSTLNNAFTPTSGSAAIQVFNAAAGTPALTILANGTALNSGATISFGNSTTFLTVPTGTVDITAMNGSSLLLDTGTMTLTPGQTTTLVIGPPTTGTTILRSFTSNGC